MIANNVSHTVPSFTVTLIKMVCTTIRRVTWDSVMELLTGLQYVLTEGRTGNQVGSVIELSRLTQLLVFTGVSLLPLWTTI